jgi:predicted AAA+ superfamily ATPase
VPADGVAADRGWGLVAFLRAEVSLLKGYIFKNLSFLAGHLILPPMALNPVLQEKLNDALVRGPSDGIRRDAVLPKVLGKAHAVTGMRRAGKTTFLLQLHADRLVSQGAERTIYLSFDDERLADLPLEQLNQLLEEYYRRFPQFRQRETVTWLLDEIQWIAGWERFVRRLLDSERVEIIVSGSSAKLLSREVHTSLRGRGMETIIRPFSFREFLRYRSAEPEGPATRLTSGARSRLENLFREYLVSGGFPEAQPLPRDVRLPLLQGYVDTVLFRDIVERYGVTQVAALRWLTRQFLKNPGGAFSVHRFHQDLRAQGQGIAKDDLYAMVGHLEDAFLIRSLSLATESERRRNSNPRKVYPVDQGMIDAFDRSGRTNVGHALETVVLHELDRRGAEVTYVKTEQGLEVDFLARFTDGSEELIQVCADPSHPETLNRELRALADAAKEHPRARQKILVSTFDVLPASAPAEVEMEPAWVWLLPSAPIAEAAQSPGSRAERLKSASKSRGRKTGAIRAAPAGRKHQRK